MPLGSKGHILLFSFYDEIRNRKSKIFNSLALSFLKINLRQSAFNP
jgi:hypothetical protein